MPTSRFPTVLLPSAVSTKTSTAKTAIVQNCE